MGLIRDHKTRIGRIRAVKDNGGKSKNKVNKQG